jgi:acyl carrier protein
MPNGDRLVRTVQCVFGEDLSGLSDSDGLDTVPGWDSAGHLDLIMAIEAEYGIEFDTEEFGELTSIGALRQRLHGLES